MPTLTPSPKKKKKGSSKNRKDKTDSNGKMERYGGDGSTSQKEVDVYEFLDNEDAVFEFRPSTLMERFKNISYNNDGPSTSKFNAGVDPDNSSDSASDGDDFVYMSDDYLCSDDETENSLMSCEMNSGKVGSDTKKISSPLKRKDALEKNAVMGKIFKHNAVRTDKKKIKETVKPTANLDQLFDSLLEDKQKTSDSYDETATTKDEDFVTPKQHDLSYKNDKHNRSTSSRDEYSSLRKVKSPSPKQQTMLSPKEYDSPPFIDYGPSTSKSIPTEFGPTTSKKRDVPKDKDHSQKKHESKHSSSKYSEPLTSKTDLITGKQHDTLKDRSFKDKSPVNKLDERISPSFDYNADVYDQIQYDDMGVARQRARRKCTVGKQNVLAESWSSESEPDAIPPRPNSAESVILTSRKKKGKKKDHHSSAKRTNRHISFKKRDVENRVNNNSRHGSYSGTSRAYNESDDAARSTVNPYDAPTPSTSTAHTHLGPPTDRPRPRPRTTAYYNWSSDGEDEQEHQPQHGWIVGDSHKKLVTMLAHAKGRKRNNDDKRHFVE